MDDTDSPDRLSRRYDLPDPVWPSTDWPAGPITRPEHLPAVDGDEAEDGSSSAHAWTLVLGILGGVLLGTGVTLGVLGMFGFLEEDVTAVPATTLTAVPTTAPPPAISSSSSEAPSVTEVAATAVPSIVAVEVTGPAGFGGGSGVVYTNEGHIITNNHVVEEASEVAVVFADGIRYPAEIVGTDPRTDIAVLVTERPDLTPIRVGTGADLVIGERAVAVGNPLALRGGPSVTTGILSATGRSLVVTADDILYGLIQTDAPITRGSSGGALLDTEAKLIGITTAIGVSDVGAEGLGFAVPVDLVVSVADDIIADGTVAHAMLGIRGNTVTDTIDSAQVPLGVLVDRILEPSAYGESGGQVEDVIVRLANQPVTSIDRLIARLLMYRAGDEVAVEVLRGEEELTIPVTLGEYQISGGDESTDTTPEGGGG